MTTKADQAGVSAEVVLRALRRRVRWATCAELAAELGLPRHTVKLALLRLGMDGLVERSVLDDGMKLAEAWKAAQPERRPHQEAAE
jgi:DNA-binding IclR family transcriptional regulator